MKFFIRAAAGIFAIVSLQAVAQGDAAAGQAKSAICAACHGADGNAGCLALNTLADKGTEDPDILATLQEGYGMRMQMITGAVARAQTEGSLRGDWAPERIASMINVMSAGMVTAVRGPIDKETAHALVDDFLDTIKLDRDSD